MNWAVVGLKTGRLSGLAPVVVSAEGLVISGLWVWYVSTFSYFDSLTFFALDDTRLVLKLVETAIVIAISGTLGYSGYWFATREFTAEQEWWGALWMLIGGLGIVSVVLVITSHQMVEGATISQRLIIEEAILGAAGGSLAGLLIGIGSAQSMRQADTIANQRDAFEFLNKLLRHNILNSINVIYGNARRLDEGDPHELQSHLDTIIERCDAIADFTRDVRPIAGVIAGDAELRSVDLANVLRTEVETARSSFPEAEFVTDIPDGVTVRANAALGAVFEKLLTNAVEHNDSDQPRIHVTVKNSAESVTIAIADNGPGIDDKLLDSLFEPKAHGDHGMGLFLVETMVSQFGGTVEVTDNEPRGSVFSIELPNHARRSQPDN